MASYKEPGLQERMAAAARARNSALAQLKAKPPVDPEILAERAAARLAREAADAEKRAAARLAREEAQAAKRAAALEEAAAAEAARIANQKPELTEEERKAARDAKYAARKNKKNGR